MDKYLGTTPKQRKMARAVAADVLKTMRYLQVKDHNLYLGVPEELDGRSIQNAKPGDLKRCEVCARGAMFISHCKLFNGYTFDADLDGDNAVVVSGEDFGYQNARLIEIAFECGKGYPLSARDDYGNPLGIAEFFGHQYTDPRKRLRAIMKNVIEHKGVFRPDKDPRVIKQTAKENAA